MPDRPMKPNRQSIRLKGYDYSAEGAYFVTMVCKVEAFRGMPQRIILILLDAYGNYCSGISGLLFQQ